MASIKSLIESGRYRFPILEDDSAERLRKGGQLAVASIRRRELVAVNASQVWIDL
jgi:hypothetical protein